MQRKQIRLEEIEPTYGPKYRNPDLVKRVREFGWREIPPIPVIKIPESLRTNGKKYSTSDGHHRYNTALKTSVKSLDCIVYGPSDNVAKVSQLTGGDYILDYHTHIHVFLENRRSCD